MYQDLVWAQWFQDNLLTFQGGAATRGGPGGGHTARIAEFLLGGPAASGEPTSWRYALSDYQWPRVIWEMALADRHDKGEYAFVSRKPNEDEAVPARPEGTEDSMLLRHDARIVRYSWVTPDYILGLRMDHPRALYSHIFGSGQGIIFPTTPDSLIDFSAGRSYLAVQHRNVAMLQPKIDHNMQSMPLYTRYGFPDPKNPPAPSVWFGKDIDRLEEKDRWVFVQEGDAYAAFRIVSAVSNESGVYDKDGFWLLEAAKDNYTWQENAGSLFRTQLKGGRKLVATAPYAPLIIEASRKAHHSTLGAFQKDVLDPTFRTSRSTFLANFQGRMGWPG